MSRRKEKIQKNNRDPTRDMKGFAFWFLKGGEY